MGQGHQTATLLVVPYKGMDSHATLVVAMVYPIPCKPFFEILRECESARVGDRCQQPWNVSRNRAFIYTVRREFTCTRKHKRINYLWSPLRSKKVFIMLLFYFSSIASFEH